MPEASGRPSCSLGDSILSSSLTAVAFPKAHKARTCLRVDLSEFATGLAVLRSFREGCRTDHFQ
jgi:hypothetical protein